MPRYANVRTAALRRLLLRMGFVETARNDHWRYRHMGLRLRVHVSFGRNELPATQMGRIITQQLQMTVNEFRAAMNGDIPERFTNPKFWSD